MATAQKRASALAVEDKPAVLGGVVPYLTSATPAPLPIFTCGRSGRAKSSAIRQMSRAARCIFICM